MANSLLAATGVRAADEEVLDLGEGLSIEDALELAAERGLAGIRLASFTPVATINRGFLPLVLGVELPGPHAVLALGDSWVTWGQRYPSSAFAGAVVEEVWEVRWAA